MRFTGPDFDALRAEVKKVDAFNSEFRVPITFPIAQNLEDYAKRPYLQFEENLVIRCQGNLGKFTPQQYHLLQRLVASPTGEASVGNLCQPNEELRLAALWNNVPVEGSLRNLASKINGNFAKYGMPWALSFSNVHYCFILRFLPDPQAERRKYPRYLGKIFAQNSFSCNAALPIMRHPDSPVLSNKPPFGYVQLE